MAAVRRARVQPAGVLSLRRRLYLAAWRLSHRGGGRWCPACGATFHLFAPYGDPARADAQCAACGSLERHRALWLFLERYTQCLRLPLRVLAVAPDSYLERRSADLPWDYLSIDVEPGKAMRRMDLTALSLPDGDRDLVIAYHVLEHIRSDRSALGEIRRILRPDGMAILEVPLEGDETDERYVDAPAGVRARHYGQPDHVRLYGERDFRQRLSDAGLRSRPIRVGDVFPDELERSGLMPGEKFFVAEVDSASSRQHEYGAPLAVRRTATPTGLS